jgi:hypothetical protein
MATKTRKATKSPRRALLSPAAIRALQARKRGEIEDLLGQIEQRVALTPPKERVAVLVLADYLHNASRDLRALLGYAPQS